MTVGLNYVFSLIKDGPVYPVLKEIIKEAFELLSLAFGEFKQLLFWLLLRCSHHFTQSERFLNKTL